MTEHLPGQPEFLPNDPELLKRATDLLITLAFGEGSEQLGLDMSRPGSPQLIPRGQHDALYPGRPFVLIGTRNFVSLQSPDDGLLAKGVCEVFSDSYMLRTGKYAELSYTSSQITAARGDSGRDAFTFMTFNTGGIVTKEVQYYDTEVPSTPRAGVSDEDLAVVVQSLQTAVPLGDD